MYLDSSYPTAVFCIIATEFCERLSFCGLRTILSIYLRNILLFSEDTATIIYHIFIMICYIIPLIGAICADSFFGRYRTIRNFSLIYLLGNLLMCVAAIPVLDHNPTLMSGIGLLLVAIGTGGLKPCVAAFGAEQFHLPEQSDLLRYFFSIFYFTINLGGFVGMILTPVMRKAVTCFGDDTCYALGFGFPAVLMLISILLFILGKSFYKMKIPKRNIMVEFAKCSSYALIKKCKTPKSQARGRHWLDYSRKKFDQKLIYDMKIVFAILLVFVPVPLFWSLFDQQGSRWTFQASHMNGNIFGVQVVPDQMQVINPAMVLVMIPIFDKLLYPCCEKINVFKNPLHRMAFGGLAAGLSFFAAGLLELKLEKSYPQLPGKRQASVNIINTLPCSIIISSPFRRLQVLDAEKILRFQNLKCHNKTLYNLRVKAPIECHNLRLNKEEFEVTALLQELQEDSFLIGVDDHHQVKGYISEAVDFSTSISGAPKFRVDFVKNTNTLEDVTVSLTSTSGLEDVYFVGDQPNKTTIIVSPYIEIPQGVFECKISSKTRSELFLKKFHFSLGGVYSLIVRENKGEIKFVKLFTMSDPNSVNILWQLPQYFLISVAEIMFGVAGLEFSFTQAPKSMKTVTIAAWYLSSAVGNLFVIIITQINFFESQAHEFFMFAILIVIDMMVFMEIASKYSFVELEVDSSALIANIPNKPVTNEENIEEEDE
ncbi:peptide transporter family 1-like [Anthonomus grandis grandis]|uniref:peptide transporter family 1-like n=1 Tax=Anthonomus grandis grandis TaxID=2921223 RepID=UPI002165485C|nr:peptide transporter family 1-like [Anthonomus grandis grandis]